MQAQSPLSRVSVQTKINFIDKTLRQLSLKSYTVYVIANFYFLIVKTVQLLGRVAVRIGSLPDLVQAPSFAGFRPFASCAPPVGASEKDIEQIRF